MTVQAVLDEIRERPGTGEVITVVDPATEEQVTEFKDCGPEAVERRGRAGEGVLRIRVSGGTSRPASGPKSCGASAN